MVTAYGLKAVMIRLGDLNTSISLKVIQEVLEEYLPHKGDTYFEYENPEGFGGHYVDNIDIMDVEKVLQKMLTLAQNDVN